MTNEEQGKKMGQVITKAWADEAFKQRLLKDATAVLKAEGMVIPDGMEVRAVENTEKLFHIVLPLKPAQEELEDEILEQAAGGKITGCRKYKSDYEITM